MTIVWDAPLTAATGRALADRLGAASGRGRGARLRALHLDHAERSLLLWFREHTLVFRLRPDDGALLLLDPAEPLDAARRLSATVEAVECPADDRVLLLRVRKVRGDRAVFTIAVELITNRWNAVVAEGHDRRIRHVLRESRSSDRTLAVGSVYEPPSPSGREGADGELSLERWRSLLAGSEPGERRGVLLSRVAWSSAINADALLGGAGNRPGDGTSEGQEPAEDERRLADGWRLWRRIADVARGAEPAEPVVLSLEEGLQPYPLPLPGTEHTAAEDLLDGMRAAAEEGGAGAVAAIPSRWIRALEKRLGAARGKVRGLGRELEKAPDPQEVRAVGDLLLARYGEIPSGAERAVLTDFEGEEVEVELDPRLSPHENAARYYEEATRAERARERIPRLRARARAEAERLEELLQRVREGDAGAEEVAAELPEAGGADEEEQSAPSLPYRRYRSSGGIEIRVGRGARSNDELTFHHSRPDDVWLHARHTAGAHVILRWDREGNPPTRDLAEAAVLAALHSKARTSGSVPVDWTRRKYVRSPRKASPGTVVPDRVRTVFVEPDPAVEERLREE